MAASTVMTQDAWEAALSSGKYSKTWLTNTMKRMQDHERQLALMNWLSKDEEAKYFAGVALGAATGVMGELLTGLVTGSSVRADGYKPGFVWVPGNPQEVEEQYMEYLENLGAAHTTELYYHFTIRIKHGKYVPADGSWATDAEGNPLPFIWLLMGGPGGLAGLGAIAFASAAPKFDPSFGMAGNVAQVMKLAGTGFAGFCATVLILKAIFSGTDLGELMSGAGEIIPL